MNKIAADLGSWIIFDVMRTFFTPLIYIALLTLFGCTKESLLTDPGARITTSLDTLHFDTLFTATGSFTQKFTIKNQNDQKLNISSIRLAGGNSSVFNINVNGEPGPSITNMEVGANDSIHVFVNASLPSGQQQLPFIVQDSIEINWNGNAQWVQLDAWGQNARYIRNGIITANTSWNNELPYVIQGALTINENATLQIYAGTRIYLHADAVMFVDGSIRVNGDSATKDRVVFSGDRLDEPYKNFPAAWPGIYLRPKSSNNLFEYAIINNAYQAIITEGQQAGAGKKLTMNQCIINNAWDAGLLAVNSSAELNNCLISNCGKNVQLVYGGNYAFNHCTLASYSNILSVHKDPVLLVSNMIKINEQVLTAPLSANFTNTIFWGDAGTVENEVVAIKEGDASYLVSFNDGLWKMVVIPSYITALNMINTDPQFLNNSGIEYAYDFRLADGSPAIDKGSNSSLIVDLDGKNRKNGHPDLGAYEKQ